MLSPTRSPILFALALAACSSTPPLAESPDGSAPAPTPMETAAFSLTLSTDKLPVLQGASGTVEATVVRKGGFSGAITIAQTGLPGGATLAPVTIAPEQTTATLIIAAAPVAPHSLPTAVTIQATSGAATATRPLTVTVHGPPGSLDTSFAGGKVVLPMGASDDYAYAIAAQADGKLLLAGRSAEHRGDLAVVRLERDGAIDATFGNGGKVLTDLGGSETAYAIAVQPDGKIVVAGTSAPSSGGQDFAVVRYLTDGMLDPGFGTGGKVVTSFGNDADTAYAIAIQPDGKLLVAGDTGQGASTTGMDYAIARYATDGTLDPSFGTGGKVITALVANGGRDSIYALALQELGGETRILAAGGEGDFSAARFTASGQLDASFGNGGKVTGLLGSVIGAARAVKVTTDGKVLLAGHQSHDFALVRLTEAGQLDTAFGTGGKTITAVSASNWDEVQGMALESDGKIVVAGWAYENNSSAGNFAVARYGSNGLLDTSFGGTGIVLDEVAAPAKADQATAVLLQTDERVPTVRVVVAGHANGSNSDFAVTRHWR